MRRNLSERMVDKEEDKYSHSVARERSVTLCGAPRPFAQLAQCEETYEVCRMFLAALQLTNQGNVDIVSDGSVDDGSLSLSLQLISSQVACCSHFCL